MRGARLPAPRTSARGASGPRLFRRAASPAESLADTVGNRGLLTMLRGGQPLRSQDRSFFEGSYGVDLAGVRVHADPEADRLARSYGAEAFAYGKDVVFAAGRYQPDKADGRRLLAHELAHVAQHRGEDGAEVHRSADEVAVSHPGDAAEVAADRAADRALSGAPARVDPHDGPAKVHRVIPTAASRAAEERKKNATEMRKRLAQYRDWIKDSRFDSERQKFEKLIEIAELYIAMYEKGSSGGSAGAGAMPMGGLVVSPGYATPPVVVSPGPAAPGGVGVGPGTSGGAGMLGLGAVLAIGAQVLTNFIFSPWDAGVGTPIPLSKVEEVMNELGTQILKHAVPTATPSPPPVVQPAPQPVPKPDPVPETKTKDPPPQPNKCPPDQPPYSQAAQIARVVALMAGGPQRLLESGQAKNEGSAKFLTTIKSNAAVIMAVSPQECVLAAAEGTHDKGDEDHAEEKALAALKPWRDSKPKIPPGSRLSVAVSASPCGEDRHNCWGKLQKFAMRAPILAYDPSKSPYLVIVTNTRPRK